MMSGMKSPSAITWLSSVFIGGQSASEREYGEDAARMIDVEIRSVLEASDRRVRKALEEKRSVLAALARLLVEQEVVDRDALTALLATPGREATGVLSRRSLRSGHRSRRCSDLSLAGGRPSACLLDRQYRFSGAAAGSDQGPMGKTARTR
jgi:hypothetical protein